MQLCERDVGSTWVSLSWAEDAELYGVAIEEPSGQWRVMSNKLTSKTLMKRNLSPDTVYKFRGQLCANGEWTELGDVFTITTLTTEDDEKRMKAPTCLAADQSSISIQWDSVVGASGYQVEMRERTTAWNTIAQSISGTALKKKHLVPNTHYTFRVRPLTKTDDTYHDMGAFSTISNEFTLSQVASGFTQLLGEELITPKYNNVKTVDALAGKIVLVYFSASWCPPCQKFTPQLIEFYKVLKENNRNVEIVYCSSDSDQPSYTQYYGKMPWLALPFGSAGIQKMSSYFQVKGIPNLKVFSSKSGSVLCDNAVQVPLSLQTFDSWAKRL